jgi:hypothetical protein
MPKLVPRLRFRKLASQRRKNQSHLNRPFRPNLVLYGFTPVKEKSSTNFTLVQNVIHASALLVYLTGTRAARFLSQFPLEIIH